jgi:inhibitor of cysteine peptidase
VPKIQRLTFTDKDDKKVVPVRVGDRIEIRLVSNASTGYRWDLLPKSLGGLTALGKPTYISSKTGMPGAPGTQVWSFRVSSKLPTNPTFAYSRPWEKGEAPAKTFTLNIKVK